PAITTTVPANPSMAEAGGALITATDLPTLAARIGRPADVLAQTVAGYNEAIARDELTRLVVPRSVRKHQPMPISTAPFHAVPLCTGVTGTMGGVVINDH